MFQTTVLVISFLLATTTSANEDGLVSIYFFGLCLLVFVYHFTKRGTSKQNKGVIVKNGINGFDRMFDHILDSNRRQRA